MGTYGLHEMHGGFEYRCLFLGDFAYFAYFIVLICMFKIAFKT